MGSNIAKINLMKRKCKTIDSRAFFTWDIAPSYIHKTKDKTVYLQNIYENLFM